MVPSQPREVEMRLVTTQTPDLLLAEQARNTSEEAVTVPSRFISSEQRTKAARTIYLPLSYDLVGGINLSPLLGYTSHEDDPRNGHY